MPDDRLIKSLLDPVLQKEVIEKETEVLRRLMRETCSEILVEAVLLGALHLEFVALDAVGGISAIAGSQLAESGFVSRENLPEKACRFRCAACRSFIGGADNEIRNQERKL